MTRTCLGRPTLKKTMFIRNVNLKQLMFIAPLFSNHLTHCQLMSLGTGAIKDWWGPCWNTRHSREVPCQPYKREPALHATTNEHYHTQETLLTWYREPIPMRCGKAWVLHWHNRGPKWSTKLNWAGKQQIIMVTLKRILLSLICLLTNKKRP